ncbi:MAG: oxygenase MpaB family protein [Actinomycetota bacterium]|nr:oxygenase MpaB family protein [Actinomycetota bacterium]
MIEKLKARVVGSTTALFSHGPQPLANTLSYRGDPGLLGPDSVSWEVIGDVTAFVGGIRALVVQTAHPEVVAGVEEHSQYRSDPLGRLSRTSVYVAAATYGAMPEVEAAVAVVRRAHVPVRGVSERDKPYSAGQPAMAAWVHNVLTDSFLVAFQTYGPRTLTADEADQFVAEQARVGALLGADPLPTSAAELSRWIAEHPALAPTRAQAQAIDFLRNPPLPVAVKLGYRLLFNAAVATVPATISRLIGLTPPRRGRATGRRSVAALRWALGSSPSWHLALVRVGAQVPPGWFRQPLPRAVDGSADRSP